MNIHMEAPAATAATLQPNQIEIPGQDGVMHRIEVNEHNVYCLCFYSRSLHSERQVK